MLRACLSCTRAWTWLCKDSWRRPLQTTSSSQKEETPDGRLPFKLDYVLQSETSSCKGYDTVATERQQSSFGCTIVLRMLLQGLCLLYHSFFEDSPLSHFFLGLGYSLRRKLVGTLRETSAFTCGFGNFSIITGATSVSMKSTLSQGFKEYSRCIGPAR